MGVSRLIGSNILRHLAEVDSCKQIQGLFVGVNLHGLHGYESPDLLENRAEVGSCKQVQLLYVGVNRQGLHRRA